MKTLSLWQPHAQAISLGIKPYETRGWYTSYRGPLAIHAAKKLFDYRHYPADYYQEVCRQLSRAGCPCYALDYGKILCVVDVVDCVPTGKLRGRIGGAEFWGDFRDVGDDGKKRYALKLACVRLIDANKRPAVIGRQGFFNVPDNILQLN
jgi:hypothetical protein